MTLKEKEILTLLEERVRENQALAAACMSNGSRQKARVRENEAAQILGMIRKALA